MSLHFRDSLFADFSFAQGKSIRCLCFAQLRTSFRLAANCSSSVGTYPVSAGHRCRPRTSCPVESAEGIALSRSVLQRAIKQSPGRVRCLKDALFRRDPGLACANFMGPLRHCRLSPILREFESYSRRSSIRLRNARARPSLCSLLQRPRD